MLNNIEEYNKLRKRSKKVINSLDTFLDHPKEFENMMMKKCPNDYKKNIEIKNKEQINNSVIKRIEAISKSLNLNIGKDDLLNIVEDKEEETYTTDVTNICTNNNCIYIDKEKYNTIKIYIENNIKENIFFRDKLINEELMNIVSLNNLIEIFKTNISKIIKRINDNITDYFKKLDELEENFNTQILNFFSEVKNNDHPSIVLSIIEFTLLYTREVNKWRGAIFATHKPSSSVYNKRNKYKKLYILCKYNYLKNVKSKKKKFYVEKIKDFVSLIGGEVKINHGTFKDCHGVILDIKKTQKDEYEFLVVINQNELVKYPKNILKKFGKSYWFNIKELQIQKIKNSFFNNYNNFYSKKEQPQNKQENNLNNIKEQLNNIHENLLLQYGHEINGDDFFMDPLDDFTSKGDAQPNIDQPINKDIQMDGDDNKNVSYT
ncbi:hypothetical protein PFMC_02563 [Plasmodium falciparum CAMP/Malaysia]|uniref:Uncharacterized protein n=1 Tax=Plasmodium falciparum (isolate Camp / Malaysia) TaxID=5835 RepID=A0A024X971_PLAFC|nr:hypothetical protein PFMC_02563 [Plasmodium falciparum CAMP/Malaysia]